MFGMMVGTATASIPEIILMSNWLLEGQFKQKWNQLKSNKIYWSLIAIYLLHLLSVIYSNNLSDAINDLRVKLPLFVLPTVYFCTQSLSKKELHMALICFIGGVFANTAWCYVFSFVIHQLETVREVSRFMSHIRLGLFVNLAILCAIYLMSELQSIKLKIVLVILIAYFTCMLMALALTAGIGFLGLIIALGSIILIVKKIQRKYVLIGLTILIISILFVGENLMRFKQELSTIKESPSNLKLEKTKAGNYFRHDSSHQIESGFIVNMNVNYEEVQNTWNQRYPNDTFNIPQQYNLKRFYILSRYFSSKGLPGEAHSFNLLSEKDYNNILNNVPNPTYPSWNSMKKRFYELVWDITEYQHGANINGHSFSMRLHYWEVALSQIKKKWLFGYGIGGVNQSMQEGYTSFKTQLDKNWQLRPHQQFLTITLGLGLVGLLFFITSLIYPMMVLRKQLPVIYFVFMVLTLVSFLFEDTLETIAGICFYAVFNSVMLSYIYFNSKQNITSK
jgi:hypothetical protein